MFGKKPLAPVVSPNKTMEKVPLQALPEVLAAGVPLPDIGLGVI